MVSKALLLTHEIRKKCKCLTLIIGRDVREGAFSALGWSRSVHFGTTTLECNPEASNRV